MEPEGNFAAGKTVATQILGKGVLSQIHLTGDLALSLRARLRIDVIADGLKP